MSLKAQPDSHNCARYRLLTFLSNPKTMKDEIDFSKLSSIRTTGCDFLEAWFAWIASAFKTPHGDFASQLKMIMPKIAVNPPKKWWDWFSSIIKPCENPKGITRQGILGHLSKEELFFTRFKWQGRFIFTYRLSIITIQPVDMRDHYRVNERLGYLHSVPEFPSWDFGSSVESLANGIHPALSRLTTQLLSIQLCLLVSVTHYSSLIRIGSIDQTVTSSVVSQATKGCTCIFAAI